MRIDQFLVEIRPPTHIREVEMMVAGYHDDNASELAEVAVERAEYLSTKHDDVLKVALDAHHIFMEEGRCNSVLAIEDGKVAEGSMPHYSMLSKASFDIKTQTSSLPKRKFDDREDKISDDLGCLFPSSRSVKDHHVHAGRCRTRDAQNMITIHDEKQRISQLKEEEARTLVQGQACPLDRFDLPTSSQEPLDYAFVLASIRENQDPKTYSEAMTSNEREQWKCAITTEINNLMKRGVIVEVDPPVGELRFVDTKYVFKKKEKNGLVYKYKCRIVARGFSQIEHVDYYATMAPVARSNSLRIFLSISVHRGHTRRSIDFDAAFLYSPLGDEVLYCKPFEGWQVSTGKVLQIMKGFYGVKQSGRYWNVMISDYLISKGFTKCVSEQCMFIRNEGRQMILLYVIILFSSSTPSWLVI